MSSRAVLADCSSAAKRFCKASSSAGEIPAEEFLVTSCTLARKSVVHVSAPAPQIVEEDPITLEDGNFATVLTFNDRMCRWPIGDPAENEFHFCGHKPKSGSPYCEAHARKAYQPQPQRRDRRATG